MFKFLKEIYKEFLYMPKHGEPTERAVLTRLVISLSAILACVSIIGYSAVAYFSDSASTTLANISAANFGVNLTIGADEVEADQTIVIDGDGESGVAQYVTISATGTATRGYCKIIANGMRYFTKEIERGDEITVEIFAKNGTEIQFVPMWGFAPEEASNQIDLVGVAEMLGMDDQPLYVYHLVESGETVDDIAYAYNVGADVVRYAYSMMWECDFDPEIEFLEGEELMIPVDPAPFAELIEAEYERIEAEKIAEEEAARAAEETLEAESENENEVVSDEISEENAVESNENSSETVENAVENITNETEITEEDEGITLSDDTTEEFSGELFDILKENLGSDEESGLESVDPITYDYDFKIRSDLFEAVYYVSDGEEVEVTATEGLHEFYFEAAPDMAEGYVHIILGGTAEFFTLPITSENELRLEIETPENAEIFFKIYAESMSFDPNMGYVGDDLTIDDEESDKYIDYEMYVETEVIETEIDDNSENEDDSELNSADSDDEGSGNLENDTAEDVSLDETTESDGENDAINEGDPENLDVSADIEYNSSSESSESSEKEPQPEYSDGIDTNHEEDMSELTIIEDSDNVMVEANLSSEQDNFLDIDSDSSSSDTNSNDDTVDVSQMEESEISVENSEMDIDGSESDETFYSENSDKNTAVAENETQVTE